MKRFGCAYLGKYFPTFHPKNKKNKLRYQKNIHICIVGEKVISTLMGLFLKDLIEKYFLVLTRLKNTI